MTTALFSNDRTFFMSSWIFKDAVNDEDLYTPGSEGINVAFFMWNWYESDLLEWTDIVNVYANTVIQNWVQDPDNPDATIPERVKEPLSIEWCGDTFGDADPATTERLKLSEKYCFSDKEWSVKGTYISPEFRYIELQFTKCINDTVNPTCATPEEIDDALDSAAVDMFMLNKNINFQDYDEPIRAFFDDTTYVQAQPQFRKLLNMYV